MFLQRLTMHFITSVTYCYTALCKCFHIFYHLRLSAWQKKPV